MCKFVTEKTFNLLIYFLFLPKTFTTMRKGKIDFKESNRIGEWNLLNLNKN